jgi:hypothetical protein
VAPAVEMTDGSKCKYCGDTPNGLAGQSCGDEGDMGVQWRTPTLTNGDELLSRKDFDDKMTKTTKLRTRKTSLRQSKKKSIID